MTSVLIVDDESAVRDIMARWVKSLGLRSNTAANADVTDAYDAMTQTRAYRKRIDSSDAISELLRWCPTQFDPKVVEAFSALLSRH
jgi:CheY-like chemotaxis protein